MEIFSKEEIDAIEDLFEGSNILPKSRLFKIISSAIDKMESNNKELQSRKPYYPWRLAPSWANWAAVDITGAASWYEKRPSQKEGYNFYVQAPVGKWKMIENFEAIGYNWADTLEKRPDNFMED